MEARGPIHMVTEIGFRPYQSTRLRPRFCLPRGHSCGLLKSIVEWLCRNKMRRDTRPLSQRATLLIKD